jgi:hypothetical protein
MNHPLAQVPAIPARAITGVWTLGYVLKAMCWKCGKTTSHKIEKGA